MIVIQKLIKEEKYFSTSMNLEFHGFNNGITDAKAIIL